MAKIITTPMCEDVLKIAGLTDYNVVKPGEIKDADLAILLSETETDIPKLSVKLNTYNQVLDSVKLIQEKFDTNVNSSEIKKIEKLAEENNSKRNIRKTIHVKVYSNFLKDTVSDMGFIVTDSGYDFIVCPDYLKDNVKENEDVVIIPSHRNVTSNIIDRINERYSLLERELCMKQ